METWKCDVCAKMFSGLVCYQQHQASEKHKKKIRLMNGVTFEAPELVNPYSINKFHCSVCMASISGMDNYQKHVNSLDHAIMIQKKSGDLLSQFVSPTFEFKSEQNYMEHKVSLTRSIATVKPFAECKPCLKQFSGIENYQQHLESPNHIKRCGFSIQNMQSDETDSNAEKEKVNSDLPNDSQFHPSISNISKIAPQTFFKCDVCQMQFTGELPYQLHLVSDSHKVKAGNQLAGKLFAENQCAFKCNECAMTFSGSIPYQQHLVSNGHKKKLNNAKLSNQLAMGTIDITSKPDYISLEQSNVNNNQMLYCEICKKQCSGPIPYIAHLESRYHLKNVRFLKVEENMRKIRESYSLSCVGNDKIGSNLSNEVTSTTGLNSQFTKKMQESNANDSIALPNLNIISPEKLDIIVFSPEEEIVFRSPGIKQKIQEEKSPKKDRNYY